MGRGRQLIQGLLKHRVSHNKREGGLQREGNRLDSVKTDDVTFYDYEPRNVSTFGRG